MIRIGNSIDSHAFKAGNGFVLGGVFIPCNFSVIAHSDGDCLYHVVSESLLGSLALGSLGENYPDSDEKYHNLASSYFVKDAYQKVLSKGYIINNLDVQILLDAPKLKPYILKMRQNLAELLNLELDQVSIKATTLEGLADLSKKGVTCLASVLITNES